LNIILFQHVISTHCIMPVMGPRIEIAGHVHATVLSLCVVQSQRGYEGLQNIYWIVLKLSYKVTQKTIDSIK